MEGNDLVLTGIFAKIGLEEKLVQLNQLRQEVDLSSRSLKHVKSRWVYLLLKENIIEEILGILIKAHTPFKKELTVLKQQFRRFPLYMPNQSSNGRKLILLNTV